MSEDLIEDSKKIAVILDDKVLFVLTTELNLGNTLLSNPEFVDVTERNVETEGPDKGWTWDGSSFSNPYNEQNLDFSVEGTPNRLPNEE
jgi:hypothetical protein